MFQWARRSHAVFQRFWMIAVVQCKPKAFVVMGPQLAMGFSCSYGWVLDDWPAGKGTVNHELLRRLQRNWSTTSSIAQLSAAKCMSGGGTLGGC